MSKLVDVDVMKAALKVYCEINHIHPDIEMFSAIDFNDFLNTIPDPWIPMSGLRPKTGAHILIVVKWDKDDIEVMEEDWGVLEHMVKNNLCTEIQREIYEKTVAWMPMPEYREKKW